MNVLRDYAAFASWELSRLGRQQLLDVINGELSELQQTIARRGLGAALAPADGCTAGCGGAHRARTAFHAVLPEARFAFAGEPVDLRLQQRLMDATADVLRRPDEHTCPVLGVVSMNGAPAVLVWRAVFAPNSRPTGIVGFVSDGRFVATVFEKLLQQTPLLPPSQTAASADRNAALRIRVSAEGHPLFASAQEWSPYAATQELPPALGGLRLSVALKPEAAERLVIGGLPRERLPLVIGLLVLTAGLVAVALVQLRREAELSRLRADFVSGVSHELRTPLAQIRLFTETLLLGRVRSNDEARRSLEIIGRDFARHEISLADLARVCRRGGRVAVTAWGSLANAAARLWADKAVEFVPREQLDAAFLAHIPWDAHFSNPQNLQRAFHDRGFQRVRVVTREYVIEMTRSDFLLAREGSVQGMLLERALAAPQWREFQTRVEAAFQREFDVHLAIGEKPGG